MTALTTIRPKLSKLIPLLGSDKAGEVVATAGAITRALKQAGADWHDLTAVLTGTKRPDTIEPLRWCDLSQPEQAGWLDRMLGSRLSPWEREFCTSINAQFSARQRPLSRKQIAILDRIIRRLVEARR